MARTKEKNHTFADSGISVHDNVIMSVSNEMQLLKHIILIVMTFAGLFGSMFSFLSYFDFQYDKRTFIICNLIYFAVFTVILNLPNKLKLLILPICLLYETAFVRQRDEFINGIKAMFNVIAKEIHLTYGDIMYYRLDETVDAADATTLFFLLTSFLFSLMVCCFTYIPSLFPLGIAATFFLVETGLYYGFTPSYPAFALVIAYWVFLTARGLSGYHSNSEKGAGFVRNGNKFYSKANSRLRSGEFSGITAAVLAVILFIIPVFTLKYTGYERSEKINKARADIKKSVSEFSIENIPESLSKFSSSFGNSPASPGNLGQFSNIQFTNEVDITASFDKLLNNEMYLKCYTGSYYSDNKWSNFPDDTYSRYSEMFEDFDKKEMYPQNFLNISSHYLPNNLQCYGKLKFSNKKNKLFYLPYSSDTKPFENEYDSAVISENKTEYDFNLIYTGSYENFLSSTHYAKADADDELFADFSEAENKYRNFVYSEYLQLPDNQDMNDIKNEFSYVLKKAEKRSSKSEYYTDTDNNTIDIMYNCEDIYATLCDIRTAISKDTIYTLTPGKTPATRDFTAYFLLENQKGYCSHYASAGIILARMCGIPARYAEGYIITGNDFSNSRITENAMFTVDIKDSRSHAWAEIYIDGLGWIPFEFTPGYDSGFAAAETEMINNEITLILPPEITETTTENETEISENQEINNTAEETTITENQAVETEITEQSEPYADETSSADNKDTENNNTLSEIFSKPLIMEISCIIIGFILSFALIAAVLSLKRKIKISKRNRIFEKGTPDEAALTAYHYIIALLAFDGIENTSNMHHLDFAKYAENKSAYLSEGELTAAVSTALKSDLSRQGITRAEADSIINLANRICSQTADNTNRRNKFRMKYILNLI